MTNSIAIIYLPNGTEIKWATKDLEDRTYDLATDIRVVDGSLMVYQDIDGKQEIYSYHHIPFLLQQF